MPCHGHPRESVCPWVKNVLHDGKRSSGNLQWERLDGRDDQQTCVLIGFQGASQRLERGKGRRNGSLVLPDVHFSP